MDLAVSLGRMTLEEAEAIRAEGGLAVELIERGVVPFDGEWQGWAPDPMWSPPELAKDWGDLSMYER